MGAYALGKEKQCTKGVTRSFNGSNILTPQPPIFCTLVQARIQEPPGSQKQNMIHIYFKSILTHYNIFQKSKKMKVLILQVIELSFQR